MTSRPPLIACWFDQSIGEQGTNIELKQRFEHVSNRIIQWYYFDNGDKFNQFLRDNPNMALITIMSGHFAKQYLTQASTLANLHSVYIFCGNIGKYESLKRNDPKVKGVFNDEGVLFQQMSIDIQKEFP